MGVPSWHAAPLRIIQRAARGSIITDRERLLFQLLDVSDDGFLSLMDDAGNTRDDLKVPEGDLGEEIKGAVADSRDILVSLYTAA